MKLNVLIPDLKDQQNISGIKDNNLKAIEEIFSCEVSLRGDSVYVNANDLEVAILEELFTLLNEISKLNSISDFPCCNSFSALSEVVTTRSFFR